MRSFPTLLAVAAVAASGATFVHLAPRFTTGPSDVRTPVAADAPDLASAPSPAESATRFFGSPPVIELPQTPQDPDRIREFFFTRAAYTSYGGFGRRGGGSWRTDFPEADRHFMVVLKRLTNLDGYDDYNAITLTDPALRRYPFLYALEVGRMSLTGPEIQGLRDYLEAGGFLVIDDFWGGQEWQNFEYEMARVLPGREIVDLTLDHPLFSTFYDIEEVRQTPAIGRGVNGVPTWERPDAQVPLVRGIYDDEGRLMVVINFNTDLGDAWEHAENPFYPLEYSTYAYQVGVNMVVYGMSH
ncbi:DUF4159 domain-containing protein [Gaopeijia maritima]|uniref:DUF4159 domain-containing protein n=1 Tax=Gaopeijia maritima TaxID=3119007 RepID=UPI0032465B72